MKSQGAAPADVAPHLRGKLRYEAERGRCEGVGALTNRDGERHHARHVLLRELDLCDQGRQ
jgi:hypothetical protein